MVAIGNGWHLNASAEQALHLTQPKLCQLVLGPEHESTAAAAAVNRFANLIRQGDFEGPNRFLVPHFRQVLFS